MKHVFLSLALVMTSSAFSANGSSKEETNANTPQVFFRCESKDMDFSADSLMKVLPDAKYSLTLKDIDAARLLDTCVFSLIEGNQGQIIDLVPSESLSAKVIPGRLYPAISDPSLESFKVNFEKPGDYTVYFDLTTRSFFIISSEMTNGL